MGVGVFIIITAFITDSFINTIFITDRYSYNYNIKMYTPNIARNRRLSYNHPFFFFIAHHLTPASSNDFTPSSFLAFPQAFS